MVILILYFNNMSYRGLKSEIIRNVLPLEHKTNLKGSKSHPQKKVEKKK